jgi:hypothetical protein
MTEWDLSRMLTKQWVEDGLVLDGTRNMLVGWEVMLPSWSVNDPAKFGAEPSLDFLVADEHLRLTVIELNRSISGAKPAWQVLCQVTHLASELSRTWSADNLEFAYDACWSGGHDWAVAGAIKRKSFREHHREFFNLASPIADLVGPIRRCVAAYEFGNQWASILAEFNRLSGKELIHRLKLELTSKQAKRALDRFLAMEKSCEFFSPVSTHQLLASR